MSREELRTGHRELLQRLYTPEAYFERLFHGYRQSSAFRARRAKLARTINRPPPPFGKRVLSGLRSLATIVRLLLALGRSRHLATLAPAYLSAYWHQNRPLGATAIPTSSFLTLCALHFHYFLMARHHRNTAFGIVGQATGAEPSRGLTQITKPG
jgi:hypothetical protein